MNNILTKGKGELAKISVDSIYGYDAFASKANKKLYIELLKEAMNENVCLIGFCVLNKSAYFVVKGNNKDAINSYVMTVNTEFSVGFNSGKLKIAYPLRAETSYEKIKSENLVDVVRFVHNLAPNQQPSQYPFCSYNELLQGKTGGSRVLIVELGGNISRADYANLLNENSQKKYKLSNTDKEKLSVVLKDAETKYLKNRQINGESVIVYVIADIAIRTNTPYKKIVRKLAISAKKRHDLLLATLCELVENRGYSFVDAYHLLAIDYSLDKLMVETMVELSRTKGYSYDYIAAKMGYMDYNYDVLVNILVNLHARFGYGFEEMCKKFHLQNDIILIRSRCGF